MFSKCFLLSTITLFALVHSIACAAEISTDQPATTRQPSRRRASSTAGANGNVPKEDSLTPKPKAKSFRRRDLEVASMTDLDPVPVNNYDVNVDPQDHTDILVDGTPYEASPVVNGPEIKRPTRASRTKRTASPTSPPINRKTSTSKGGAEMSKKLSKLQPAIDKDPEDYDNFLEDSELYMENSTPEQPLLEKPMKVGRTESATNGNRRASLRSKTEKLVESRPKNKGKDITAQNESIPPPQEDKFNDNLLSYGEKTSTLVTSGIEEPGKIFNGYLPNDEPEAIDGLGYTEGGDKEDESNQLLEAPLVLAIFKIISKSLGEMFSALKVVLQGQF